MNTLKDLAASKSRSAVFDAIQSIRIDRLTERIERMERRLELNG
jgi:hypothetical protein